MAEDLFRQAFRDRILGDADTMMLAYVGWCQIGEEATAKIFWNRALKYLKASLNYHADYRRTIIQAIQIVWDEFGKRPLKFPPEFKYLSDELREEIGPYFGQQAA